MYINGQATPKDGISGAFWLNRAAEKGHAAARTEYDKLIYNFSIGQKKRLERMIEEGLTTTMQTTVQ
jgi:TPR repeat protein